MSDNFFDDLKKSNPEKLNKTSDIISEALGNDYNLNKLLNSEKLKEKFNLKLSDSDKQKIAAIMSNPELLKKLLSSQKAREGLKKILGE